MTHANAGVTPAVRACRERQNGRATHSPCRAGSFIRLTLDPGLAIPMIVQVHGGPAAAVPARWMSEQSTSAVLSRDGYFVFMPNPRGSYGQGEAFTKANVKDFGYGDLRDVMAGVDTVLRRFPVDSARMGLTGWSYGGYMTMWGVTQTNRFKAAVAGAGISDWLSYTGENGIDEWMLPYFGATAYDDPAVYAIHLRRSITSRRAHTPTLAAVVGERDVECPAPQSYEFWRGLERNGVTTQLVASGRRHGIQRIRAIPGVARYAGLTQYLQIARHVALSSRSKSHEQREPECSRAVVRSERLRQRDRPWRPPPRPIAIWAGRATSRVVPRAKRLDVEMS